MVKVTEFYFGKKSTGLQCLLCLLHKASLEELGCNTLHTVTRISLQLQTAIQLKPPFPKLGGGGLDGWVLNFGSNTTEEAEAR